MPAPKEPLFPDIVTTCRSMRQAADLLEQSADGMMNYNCNFDRLWGASVTLESIIAALENARKTLLHFAEQRPASEKGEEPTDGKIIAE
jgi:hypothetical protein